MRIGLRYGTASGAERVGPFLLFAALDDIADRLERAVATITVNDVG